ncbi:MAG: hypothetical protein IPI30_23465 [Saprospiraceae bacterium]|nr:hypothetical protein [Candidatus Vicinibacter affinis]
MAEQGFVDCQSLFPLGSSGADSIHFFISKHNPKGGPDGGAGGRGPM